MLKDLEKKINNSQQSKVEEYFHTRIITLPECIWSVLEYESCEMYPNVTWINTQTPEKTRRKFLDPW